MSTPGLTSALFQELDKNQTKQLKLRAQDIGELILKRCLPPQRALILDRTSRFIAALCSRRAGKSKGSQFFAVHTALTKPGSKILIIGKVRRQIKGIHWQTLKQLCHELEIAVTFRNTELEAEFHDTGSFIYLTGADTIDEIEKFRGLDFDLVIIDEAKSYSPRLLKELIEDIIQPTLLDRMGTLLMIGTPGAILSGPFFEITGKQSDAHGNVRPIEEVGDPKWDGIKVAWSLHRWHTKDNTAMPHIWDAALEVKEMNNWGDDHPTWRREYMGEWVPDDDAMVYAYSKANTDGRCNWVPDYSDTGGPHGLPVGHHWKYLLGLDLGYKDPTAFVVAAWSETHPSLFYVHSEKHSKLTIEQIATRTKELEERFGGFMVKVADTGGLGRMLVESLAATYGVVFEAAIKTEKNAHIKFVNSDYEAGRIKVIDGSDLHEELVTLQWANDERKHEDPGCANHCADAHLYIWRWAFHHLWHERTLGPDRGSEEWWLKEQAKAEEAFRQRKLKEDQEEGWEAYAEHLNQNPYAEEWDIQEWVQKHKHYAN